jgi:hypothetical protein
MGCLASGKDSKFFATRAHSFRRNRQMNNPIHNEADMKELKYEKPFSSTKGAETNEETSMSIKDPDTLLSLIVLLLTCLGLAALAHVFV